jgi:hypothetical protein
MAKIYVTEFRNGQVQLGTADNIPSMIGIVDQTPITVGASSAQSAAFDGGTSMIRLHTDAICSVAFGTNPTATTNNMRLAANETVLMTVRPGTSFKVAVIANT